MDSKDGRVVSNFIVQAIQGTPLTIYGDGKQTRSFCFVDDLIEGLIRLINSDFQEPINLGNPKEYTILELVDAISKEFGENLEIEYRDLPIDDPKRRQPDISKAKSILQWEPKINLEKGISKTIDWFRSINK